MVDGKYYGNHTEPFKHHQKPKQKYKIDPRGIFKEAGDAGRGCNF